MGFPRAERVLAGFACTVALVASSGTLAAQQSGGASIYCCDVGGQPVCGDILPAACYGRAYREMSPSGTVRRTVAAPLTPDEIAQRAAAEHKRRAERGHRLVQAMQKRLGVIGTDRLQDALTQRLSDHKPQQYQPKQATRNEPGAIATRPLIKPFSVTGQSVLANLALHLRGQGLRLRHPLLEVERLHGLILAFHLLNEEPDPVLKPPAGDRERS